MGFILGVVRVALESKPIAYRLRVLLLVIVTGGSSGGGGGIVVVGIGARGAAPHGDKIWIGLDGTLDLDFDYDFICDFIFSRSDGNSIFFLKKKLLNMVSFSGDGECDVLILFC